MGTYYLGEIIMFGGSYSFQDFASCDGQLISIAQNQALYSIITTAFGGDGRTNFGIPDMRGKAPVGSGNAPWGQSFNWGQPYGSPEVRLNLSHLPTHSHDVAYDASGGGGGGLTVQTGGPNQNAPTSDSYFAGYAGGPNQLYTDSTGTEQIINGVSAGGFDVDRLSVEPAGGSQPFDPSGPRLAISFLICMQGNYPPRS